MSAAEKLARLALAMERLAHVESVLADAAAAGLVAPHDLPGGALRMAAADVLQAALPWPVLLEASRALGTGDPAGGPESYRAYLDSVAEYVRPHPETIQ